MLPIRRLTGETQVPVVRFADGEVVAGSARIIEVLDARLPEPALLPSERHERAHALEIQARFDEEIGPPLRCALFSVLLGEPGTLAQMFGEGHSALVRTGYRAMLPVVGRIMARSMRVNDPQAVREGYAAVESGLDFVAKHVGPSGHLVGGRFTVADLAAAALLSPVCDPPDSSMTRPRPVPASIQAWMDRWAGHPGVAWVLERYRVDRPASSALGTAGGSGFGR
jgi:glutathione S-transferase